VRNDVIATNPHIQTTTTSSLG